MSLFTPLAAKFAAGAVIAAGSIGGFTALASTNPVVQQNLVNLQTAITNKNLGDYKNAKISLIDEKSKTAKDAVNNTTQDQLNTLSDRQAKFKLVQDAIDANDYPKFQANADANMLKRVPDQASFDKMVASNKARKDAVNKLSEDIKNNDAGAYKADVISQQQAEQARHTNNTNNQGTQKTRPTPTDAQLQARFDKAVVAYKADGTLPNSNKRGIGIEGSFGHGGGRGQSGMKMNGGFGSGKNDQSMRGLDRSDQ